MSLSSIDLVFTAALSQELPVEWLRERGVQVYRLQAVKSGAFKPGNGLNSGVLAILTGVGPVAAREAALWIKEHMAPRFVVNLGTAGGLQPDARIGRWVTPANLENEQGQSLPVDTRLPFPWSFPQDRSVGGTLLTVEEAKPGTPKTAWSGRDYVDMECFAQAQVFAGSDIAFHVLKWISDVPGEEAECDFSTSLPVLRDAVQALLGFLDQEEQAEISVVIPVHNRADRIGPALQSVLGQTLPPREVIVVDDGSDDGTARELESLGESIRVVRLPENRGVSAARNAGAAVAQSSWIAFLDSDDHWASDKLSRQWEYHLSNPHYDALQCEEIWIRNGVRVNPHNHHAKPGGWIWSQSLKLCLVSPSAILMRKPLFESLGAFDETLPACEDYDLWIRLGRHHVVGLAPHAGVVKHGGHDDQLSRRFSAMDRFRVAALHKALLAEKEPLYREQLVAMLHEKLGILIQGARKRALQEETAYYESLKAELPSR